MPQIAKSHSPIPSGDRPGILSPQDISRYLMRNDAVEGSQKIPVIARAGSDTRLLYLYQDGILLNTGAPEDKLFLPLKPGRHQLAVVIDPGLSDSITYYVEGGPPIP